MSIDSLLQQFQWFGIKLGLDSSLNLLAELGNPHQQMPIVHVAGSNGKGSVCAYLSSVLTTAGYRVGRYTSPHLVSWSERICLNEQPIAPDALETLLQQVIAAIRPDQPSPTQFEVITAAAWLYFAQQQIDIAVMEVGLGGRLDATNVCDRPLVSIITTLSREHWQRLGPTLADIAREKAGILKPGCPAVIGQLPPEATIVVNRRISELGCPAIYPTPAKDLGDGWAAYHDIETEARRIELAGAVLYGTRPIDRIIKYRLPLPGAIQLHNSALAIAALLQLRSQGWEISDEQIATGIANTRWAGRLQWFSWHDRQILIDGAHNPEGAIALRQFVDQWQFANSKANSNVQPVNWVMGMMAKKDHADIFQALLRSGDRLYLVPIPDPSAAAPEQLATLAQEICPNLDNCQTYPDVQDGLAAAIASTNQPDSLIVLCGSLYLIGHFFAQVRSSDSQSRSD